MIDSIFIEEILISTRGFYPRNFRSAVGLYVEVRISVSLITILMSVIKFAFDVNDGPIRQYQAKLPDVISVWMGLTVPLPARVDRIYKFAVRWVSAEGC